MPVISARDLWKIYDGGYIALSGVDLDIYKGEIHVIVGENGAGKTTLLKIMSGAVKPTRGSIIIEGVERAFRNPREALRAGISMAYQGFSVVDGLSIRENIQVIARSAGLEVEELVSGVVELVKRIGYTLDPGSKVSRLSLSEKQALEVSIAVNAGRLAVLLDEPTAFISPTHAQRVLEILREAADSGKAVVLTSHRVREVVRVGDRYTILKRGSRALTFERGGLGELEVLELLKSHLAPPAPTNPNRGAGAVGAEAGEEILRAEGVSIYSDGGQAILKNASFSLRRGEILGIFSPDGRGVRELCEAVCGLRRPGSGSIYVKPGSRIRYIPGDYERASIPWMPVVINASLRLILGSRSPVIDLRRVLDHAATVIRASRAVVPSVWGPLKSLSGGNARRIIAWREALDSPDILVVEEPSAGLDIASAEALAELITGVSSRGASVLVVTSDAEDLLRIRCRWLALSRGALVPLGSAGAVDMLVGA